MISHCAFSSSPNKAPGNRHKSPAWLPTQINAKLCLFFFLEVDKRIEKTEMKKHILISGLFLLMMGTAFAQTSFYDFTVKDISGKEYALSQLKG